MAKVIRGNRALTVPDDKVPDYVRKGYSHVDADGKILTRGAGKEDLNPALLRRAAQLESENLQLRDRVAELEALLTDAGSTPLET